MLSAGVSSTKNGTEARRWLAWTNLFEILVADLALADVVRGRRRDSSDRIRGGELLGRHFEREEADHGAVLGRWVLPGRILAGAIGAGGVEANIGGERGLAHRRPAGEHDQIRRVQAAEELVEIDEAGRDAGGLAAGA